MMKELDKLDICKVLVLDFLQMGKSAYPDVGLHKFFKPCMPLISPGYMSVLDACTYHGGAAGPADCEKCPEGWSRAGHAYVNCDIPSRMVEPDSTWAVCNLGAEWMQIKRAPDASSDQFEEFLRSVGLSDKDMVAGLSKRQRQS
jgi:hypothetical protein